MKNTIVFCMTCVLLYPQISSAQQGTIEVGIDGAVEYAISDDFAADFGISFETPDLLTISVPLMGVRIGYFATDAVSIEPTIGLLVVGSDGETYTVATTQIGLLLHTQAKPGKARPYVRVAPVAAFTGGNGASATQFGVSGRLGVKIPLANALAANLAAGVARSFENEDFVGTTTISGTFGVSLFLAR